MEKKVEIFEDQNKVQDDPENEKRAGACALPVRMDWSTLSVVDLMEERRMSAGTLSPTVNTINKHR